LGELIRKKSVTNLKAVTSEIKWPTDLVADEASLCFQDETVVEFSQEEGQKKIWEHSLFLLALS
jgi:hypothetical protein